MFTEMSLHLQLIHTYFKKKYKMKKYLNFEATFLYFYFEETIKQNIQVGQFRRITKLARNLVVLEEAERHRVSPVYRLIPLGGANYGRRTHFERSP